MLFVHATFVVEPFGTEELKSVMFALFMSVARLLWRESVLCPQKPFR